MMRSITAVLDGELFQPGPVIAYEGSKNRVAPFISSIHDERITAVRSKVAFSALTSLRSNDSAYPFSPMSSV